MWEGKILSLFVAWEGVGRSRVGLKLGKEVCSGDRPKLSRDPPGPQMTPPASCSERLSFQYNLGQFRYQCQAQGF